MLIFSLQNPHLPPRQIYESIGMLCHHLSLLPHLGHLIGCLLPADVYARYLRQKGEDVLFVPLNTLIVLDSSLTGSLKSISRVTAPK